MVEMMTPALLRACQTSTGNCRVLPSGGAQAKTLIA